MTHAQNVIAMCGGGCSCDWCGTVFVGFGWEDGCCPSCRDARRVRADLRAARLKLDAITAQPPVSSLTSKGR